MVLHNAASDSYYGVEQMFSYIDSFIMAPHHSRDQRYYLCVIPLALATRNLFHNFLSLRSVLTFNFNILVLVDIAYSRTLWAFSRHFVHKYLE